MSDIKIKNLCIENVCYFIGGSQPPKSKFIYEHREGYIRLVQTRDYKTDSFLTYIPKHLTNKFCCKEDIMIGRYGPPIFQICRGIEGAYNVALLKAEPKNNIDREFLYYFLRQESVFNYVDKLSARTGGQTGVDLVSLNKYPIRLPESIDVQKRTVKILCLLDKKIMLNNHINAELEAMAKTLYDYWFVQFDFPDENDKPYKSSGGKMVYNEVLKREIPVGWKSGTFDNLGQIVGGSTPSTEEASHFSVNGIPWITPNDLSDNQGNKFITRGALDVSEGGMKSASLKKYPAGTILLSSRAPVGYMAIARNEVTTNQGFKSFIPTKGYTSEFLYYSIKSMLPTIIKNASGSTFKEISAGMMKTIKILLPDTNTASRFSDEVCVIFKRQDILEQESFQLAKLRDWLLPMLMNGQVTVGDSETKIEENTTGEDFDDFKPPDAELQFPLPGREEWAMDCIPCALRQIPYQRFDDYYDAAVLGTLPNLCADLLPPNRAVAFKTLIQETQAFASCEPGQRIRKELVQDALNARGVSIAPGGYSLPTGIALEREDILAPIVPYLFEALEILHDVVSQASTSQRIKHLTPQKQQRIIASWNQGTASAA